MHEALELAARNVGGGENQIADGGGDAVFRCARCVPQGFEEQPVSHAMSDDCQLAWFRSQQDVPEKLRKRNTGIGGASPVGRVVENVRHVVPEAFTSLRRPGKSKHGPVEFQIIGELGRPYQRVIEVRIEAMQEHQSLSGVNLRLPQTAARGRH